MKRFVLVLALVALAASFAVAQGTVSAYTTLEEPLAKALFEKFEAETGIKVNFVRLSGGEVVARLEAEKANPQASIWVGGVGLDHITAKGKGLTAAYKSRAAGKTPTEFKDKEGYWIGLYVGPLTFVTNTKRAAELGIKPPTSWADLLKPEYKGLIRMANPNTSGTAYNVITTLRYIFKGNEEKVFDYLKKLDANIDQYTRSGSAPGKSVAIGEIPVAIGYAHDQVKLKVEGAPVVMTAPERRHGLRTGVHVPGRRRQGRRQRQETLRLGARSPSAQAEFVKYYVVLDSQRGCQAPRRAVHQGYQDRQAGLHVGRRSRKQGSAPQALDRRDRLEALTDS